MEEIILLHDVISELLNEGYALDFDIMKSMFSGSTDTKKITNLNTSEFAIDKIYICYETEYDSEIIYVFAVSNTKHNIKGIATSISTVENDINFSEMMEKIKTGLKEISAFCFGKKSKKILGN